MFANSMFGIYAYVHINIQISPSLVFIFLWLLYIYDVLAISKLRESSIFLLRFDLYVRTHSVHSAIDTRTGKFFSFADPLEKQVRVVLGTVSFFRLPSMF